MYQSILELERDTTMSPIFIILLIAGVAFARSPLRPEPIRDCGPFAVWSTCGSACQTTCDNYKNIDMVCPAVCVRGCVCAEGRIKKSKDSYECVLPEECDN